MTHNRRGRRLLVAASIIGVIGAWPVHVDAHAVFVGAPASITADTDVALTMNVPSERDDSTYNVAIAIRLPEGWTGLGCQNKPTWTCSIGTESGLVVMRFDKDPSAAPAEDETFRINVHAGPTPGSMSFPTLQTYSTGETVAWIGPAGSAEPAPLLQVTGAAPSTTQVAPAPTNPPPTAAPATTAAAPTATTTASTVALPATTTVSTVRSSSTTTTEAAATTTTTVTATTSTTTELTLVPTVTELSAPVAGSESSSTGVIVAIVLALLAAAAGAVVYIRSRRPLRPQ